MGKLPKWESDVSPGSAAVSRVLPPNVAPLLQAPVLYIPLLHSVLPCNVPMGYSVLPCNVPSLHLPL